MRNYFLLLSFLTLHSLVFGQVDDAFNSADSLYREDQFYAGVTYNLLGNMPSGVSQNGFSSGFHLGFIRDMPINERRNVSFGLGLGYSANSFNQNIFISKESDKNYSYTVIDDDTQFSKNKFSQHLLEVPFEFRWRSSTQTEYKFWRIYSGFKVGYVIANTSKYKGSPTDEKYSGIDDFNDFQYAFTISVGYNTMNIYFYYALNPIFDSTAKIDETEIDMKAIKFGLIFYIL